MCPPYSQVVWGFKFLLFLHQTFFFNCGTLPGGLGESNGSLLQCCLENPVERGAWWATVREVTESDTTELVVRTLLPLQGHRSVAGSGS